MKILKLMVSILNVIYLPFKKLKIKNRVTMISRESDTVSEDFLMLRDKIKELDENIQVVIMCKMLGGGITGKLSYGFHMLKQMYYIATSKVTVLDTYCIAASVLKKREGTKIVQIWHSSAAVKKFGHQTLDKASGSSSRVAEAMNMHGNYDYAIAPSHVTGKLFAEAFNIPEEKIKILGLPRLDRIKKEDEKVKEAIIKEYPQTGKKENILYAPTFRKNREIDLDAIGKIIDYSRYNLIVKLHPLDTSVMKNENPGVITDRRFSTSDWFNVCGKIISDYSAVGVECTMLEREVYYYLYDLPEYKETTGLNMDFEKEAISDYVVKSADELKEVLYRPYDQSRREAFRDKYIEVYKDNSTEKLAGFIISLM